ncbi:hypothetical protein [Methylibium petroleiphilum]|nr:hypothetical protein [Methylibium petroleiphilum]
MFLYDNYELHVFLLIAGWIGSAFGFVFYLAPALSHYIAVNTTLGVVAMSVFFGKTLWDVVRRGPQSDAPLVVEQQ